MNSKLESKIQYLTAKRKYEKLLRHQRALHEQRWEPSASHASAAFVKPFTDVFKALKLTAMDIGNSARTMLGVLLTFDNKKLQEKITAFETRRGLLRTEWQPIVGDSLKAIQTADPLLSMALMPQAYLASFGLAAGVKVGAAATDIIAGEKWERLVEKLWRMPTEISALNAIQNMMQDDRSSKGRGGKSKLMKKLLGLFWKGNVDEGFLREQQAKKTTYDTSSEEAWLADFFADTGMDDTFNSLAAESADNHLSVVREVLEAAQRAETVALLVAADSPERFRTTLKHAISSNLVDPANVKELSNVLPQIDKQAKELAASDEFRKKVAATAKVEPEKVSDQELTSAAQKTAFNTGKVSFNDQAINGGSGSPGLSEFMQQLKQAQDEAELDNELLQQLKKKTDIPEVKELLQVYEKMKRSYDKAQQAINSVMGSAGKE